MARGVVTTTGAGVEEEEVEEVKCDPVLLMVVTDGAGLLLMRELVRGMLAIQGVPKNVSIPCRLRKNAQTSN